MPTTCMVYGCRNRSARAMRENKTKISFFRFPKKPPSLRKAWIQAVRWKNWEPSDTSALCSEHFAESDIDRTSMFSVRLHRNAVPSIFVNSLSHCQKRTPTKKQRPNSSNEIKITELSSNQINIAKFNSDAVFEISSIIPTVNTPTIEDQTNNQHIEVTEILNNSAEQVLEVNTEMMDKLEVLLNGDKDQDVNIVSKKSPIKCQSERKTRILNEHADGRTTQKEFDLKLQLRSLRQKYILVRKKLKISQQRVRRLTKKNNKLSSKNKELKEMERQDDILGHLKKIPGINSQLMQRQIKKISAHQNDPVEYSDEIRRFAMILHGHSASAYKFIRNSFDDCLPHSRTVGKWREASKTTCKVNEEMACASVIENSTYQTILCVIPTEN